MARSSSRKDQDNDRKQGDNSLIVALGAVGGLALGLLLTNAAQGEPARRGAARLRDRAREAARGWAGPAPLQAPQALEERGLAQLEDAVLDAFLRDVVLSERGVDVGCISPGIIELSGTVRAPHEVERAVSTARAVQGVVTVVNRIDVEDDGHRPRGSADSTATEGHMSGEWTGRNVGMGQRRQGIETENRGGLDDSQHLREVALEQSDRAQYEDEDIAHSQPLMGSRPGHRRRRAQLQRGRARQPGPVRQARRPRARAAAGAAQPGAGGRGPAPGMEAGAGGRGRAREAPLRRLGRLPQRERLRRALIGRRSAR